MVVVDHFTKITFFITLEQKPTGRDSDVAEAFLMAVWKLHRLPLQIISDMDVKFAGECWG